MGGLGGISLERWDLSQIESLEGSPSGDQCQRDVNVEGLKHPRRIIWNRLVAMDFPSISCAYFKIKMKGAYSQNKLEIMAKQRRILLLSHAFVILAYIGRNSNEEQ